MDELFLTLVPSLTGEPDAPAIVRPGELPGPAGLELVRVLEHESHLFLRYRFCGS
jgi:hypothetical protein